MITLEKVRQHPTVKAFLAHADSYLEMIGYTEHGERHASLTADIAYNILKHLGYPEREAEIAAIAGYLHDIGNVINRDDHGQSSALIAMPILKELGATPDEIAKIMGAIGNHEEELGDPVSEVAAAVILADKSDVHKTRVRTPDHLRYDIHDRVNYAVEHSFLRVDAKARTITLELTIDTAISQVMEYFEIFLSRMIICRRAAQLLKCDFKLEINNVKFL